MYGDYCMPLMCAQYRGYSIQAGAFELVGTGRFIASLLVCKVGSTDRKLIDLPVTHCLYDCAEEALSSTVEHGKGLADCFAAALEHKPD